MTLVEQMSNINIINNVELEDESDNILDDPSTIFNNENLHIIHSIIFRFKNENEGLYSKINNCSSKKESLVLKTILNIFNSCNNSKQQKILTYEDIINFTDGNKINENYKNNINYDNDDYYNFDKKIFIGVDRVAHNILHKDKLVDGKNLKICKIYQDLNTMELKEREDINFSNIDKLINKLKLKDKYKHLEFIAIKAIIIAFINLTRELIDSYFNKKKEIEINENINNEDYNYNKTDGNDENDFNLNIFETIFNEEG